MPTLLPMPSSPCSSRNAIWPRLARSSIAVVRARRDELAGQDEDAPRPASAPRVGRPSGSTGRRGRPGPGRSAATTRRRSRRARRRGAGRRGGPRTASIWRARSRVAACSGVAAASTLVDRREQRAVEVAAAEQRQHVVVEDLLLLGVVEERRPEARAAVQDAPGRARCPGTCRTGSRARRRSPSARRPTGPSAPGVGVGLVGRPAVLDGLGVDHDLGAGPRLDRRDRRSADAIACPGGRCRPCRRRATPFCGSGNGGPAASVRSGRGRRSGGRTAKRDERRRRAATAGRVRRSAMGRA